MRRGLSGGNDRERLPLVGAGSHAVRFSEGQPLHPSLIKTLIFKIEGVALAA